MPLYKAQPVGELVGDTDQQTLTNKVITNVATSAPATPADGMLWWDTDDTTGITSGNADTVDNFNASATPTANTLLALDSNAMVPTAALGGAWATWSPTWDGITFGNGTLNNSTYTLIGKTCIAKFRITFGSTTSITKGYPGIYLPVTAKYGNISGTTNWLYLRPGVAAYSYSGTIDLTDKAVMTIGNTSSTYLTDGGISSAIPHTWTTGDVLSGTLIYEAA